MRIQLRGLLSVVLIVAPLPSSALSPGTDVLVPAAARVGTWRTDLYILNTGDQSTSVALYWMIRDQANTAPDRKSFNLAPGEALDLPDVILNNFGLSEGIGAFRVFSYEEVVVSSRIYNVQNGATFGQGFNGVPRSSAVSSGGSTHIAGLANSTNFRTNLVMMDASGSGSDLSLTLYDATGTQIATRSYTLDIFEPKLENLTNIIPGLTSFDYATLRADVIRGSAVIVASKIDNDQSTGDPSTLESWTIACGTSMCSGLVCEPGELCLPYPAGCGQLLGNPVCCSDPCSNDCELGPFCCGFVASGGPTKCCPGFGCILQSQNCP